MKKSEAAKAGAREIAFYDGCAKGYIEPRNHQLPSTAAGFEAREAARKAGRCRTNKEGRIAGDAPETDGEERTRTHVAAMLAAQGRKK
jgi:hypothetical protein